MIKKLFIHIILILFTTSVVAEEILMDCKTGKYRYIKQDSDTTILYTHKKRDKGKWAGWCPSEVTEDNKAWFVSVKDHDLLITDRKGICMVSEGKFKTSSGEIGIVRSNTSVLDFVKKTYITEYFWMDEKKKTKNKTNENFTFIDHNIPFLPFFDLFNIFCLFLRFFDLFNLF